MDFFYFPDFSRMRDAETMTKALCRVQRVGFRHCYLSTNQLTSMFTKILKAPMLTLHTLDLDSENIRGVTPCVLARAICRMKRISVRGLLFLSPSQLEKLFSEIANCKNLTLTKLRIIDMDVVGLREDILASAISRLEAVQLDDIRSCTDAQLNAIFNKVASCSDSKLKELYVDPCSIDENITQVNQTLLKKIKEKVKIYTDEILLFI